MLVSSVVGGAVGATKVGARAVAFPYMFPVPEADPAVPENPVPEAPVAIGIPVPGSVVVEAEVDAGVLLVVDGVGAPPNPIQVDADARDVDWRTPH